MVLFFKFNAFIQLELIQEVKDTMSSKCTEWAFITFIIRKQLNTRNSNIRVKRLSAFLPSSHSYSSLHSIPQAHFQTDRIGYEYTTWICIKPDQSNQSTVKANLCWHSH